MSKSSGQFKFRKNQTIGAMAAEDDAPYLDQCFIDNGDVEQLLDISNPRRIILGRTGSGKTALLMEMKKRATSQGAYFISLTPADLSLHYISNSDVLKHLQASGVNLDPFFKLLWKHFFAIAILEKRFPSATSSTTNTGIWEQIATLLTSRATKKLAEQRQKQARDYIEQFGGKFFYENSVRIKQIVTTFENAVTEKSGAGLTAGAKAGAVEATLKIADSHDQQDKRVDVVTQDVTNAQKIIGEIHNQQLAGILDLIGDVLSDKQKPCYIVLDKLDESWADDSLRMLLLKALLTTIGDFREQHNTKIVICLRIDLLERIFKEMRQDSGFQEEKYRSQYLHLSWSDTQLTDLLNRRIQVLMKDSWTTYSPKIEDVFVADQWGSKTGSNKNSGSKHSGLKHILQRTWRRPRDLIDLFNSCIENSDGKARFDRAVVDKAEGEYSRRRFRSIGSEWGQLYPGLLECLMDILAKTKSSFSLSDITNDSLDKFVENMVANNTKGPLFEMANRLLLSNNLVTDRNRLRLELSLVFYKTGVAGLKLAPTAEEQWADNYPIHVSLAELTLDSELLIHKALWRVLGTLE